MPLQITTVDPAMLMSRNGHAADNHATEANTADNVSFQLQPFAARHLGVDNLMRNRTAKLGPATAVEPRPPSWQSAQRAVFFVPTATHDVYFGTPQQAWYQGPERGDDQRAEAASQLLSRATDHVFVTGTSESFDPIHNLSTQHFDIVSKPENVQDADLAMAVTDLHHANLLQVVDMTGDPELAPSLAVMFPRQNRLETFASSTNVAGTVSPFHPPEVP